MMTDSTLRMDGREVRPSMPKTAKASIEPKAVGFMAGVPLTLSVIGGGLRCTYESRTEVSCRLKGHFLGSAGVANDERDMELIASTTFRPFGALQWQ